MYERHGKSKTKIYNSWRAMRNRCMAVADLEKVANYSGRGIMVCQEWDSFPAFFVWAVENGYKPGLTLDRIDSAGHYTPENCRWATPLQQGENRTRKAVVEVDGESLTVSQWSRRLGIGMSTLFRRYYKGLRGKEFIAPINPLQSHKIISS